MVSVRTSIEIAAPPARVRDIFLDFARFHEWAQGPVKSIQPLAPDGSVEKGEKVKINFGGGIALSAPIIENSETEFTWRGGMSGLVTGQHTFRFEPSRITPGSTTFVNSEEFTGALTFLSKLFPKSDSQESPGFNKFNQSLKDRVESLK